MAFSMISEAVAYIDLLQSVASSRYATLEHLHALLGHVLVQPGAQIDRYSIDNNEKTKFYRQVIKYEPARSLLVLLGFEYIVAERRNIWRSPKTYNQDVFRIIHGFLGSRLNSYEM